MVHLETLNCMKERYRSNIKKYISEHAEEIIVMDGSWSDITDYFFKSQKQADKYLEKYKGKFGPTYLVSKIPKTFRQYRYQNDPRKILEKQLRNLDRFEKLSRKSSTNLD